MGQIHMARLGVGDVRGGLQGEMPTYATEGSAGMDLATVQDEKLTFGKLTQIPTGLIVKVPDDMLLLVLPRSSTFKKYGIIMPHSAGVIDSDYCGPEDELKLLFLLIGFRDVTIPAGTRLAQMVLVPKARAVIFPYDPNAAESRGGVGSTGR